MEGRVKSALSSGDFYTAHQTIISQCQRLERSGKIEDARFFAARGVQLLSDYKAPDKSFEDVLSKYHDLLEKYLQLKDGACLKEEVQNIIRCAATFGSNSWHSVATSASRDIDANLLLAPLIHDVTKNETEANDFFIFAASSFPQCDGLFSKPHGVSGETVLSVSALLLAKKCFATCYTWLQAIKVASFPKDCIYMELLDCDGSLPWNISSLLVELLRKMSPPKDIYSHIVSLSKRSFGQQTVSNLLALESVYFNVPKHADPAVNPLASMLQSMMMGK